MSERIGVVGLGRMGAALAVKAAAEGFETTGWTRSGGDAAAADAAGYALVPTLEDAAAAADILMLSLFDDDAVTQVLTTLAGTDLTGKLIVETSTVSPEIVRAHADAIEAAGGRLIDAPISGGPEMVLDGTMGLFIGGDPSDAARFIKVADRLSNRVAHIGPLGSGIAAKIVNNIALAGAFAAAVDSMVLGKAMGLEYETMMAFLEKSPGTSPKFKSRVPGKLGKDDTVGFAIEAGVKDSRIFLGEGARNGVDLPAMAQMSRYFDQCMEAGLGDRDVAVIPRLVLGE